MALVDTTGCDKRLIAVFGNRLSLAFFATKESQNYMPHKKKHYATNVPYAMVSGSIAAKSVHLFAHLHSL